MGEDPGEIREQIEATRDRMSETADALAYKADVRARVKDKAAVKKDALVDRVRSAAPANRAEALEQVTAIKQWLVSTARGVATNPRQAQEQSVDVARRAVDAARRNSRVVAVAGGLATLVGLRALWRASRSAPPAGGVEIVENRAGRVRLRGPDRRRTQPADRRTSARRHSPRA